MVKEKAASLVEFLNITCLVHHQGWSVHHSKNHVYKKLIG
jgi:hypothetical protein